MASFAVKKSQKKSSSQAVDYTWKPMIRNKAATHSQLTAVPIQNHVFHLFVWDVYSRTTHPTDRSKLTINPEQHKERSPEWRGVWLEEREVATGKNTNGSDTSVVVSFRTRRPKHKRNHEAWILAFRRFLHACLPTNQVMFIMGTAYRCWLMIPRIHSCHFSENLWCANMGFSQAGITENANWAYLDKCMARQLSDLLLPNFHYKCLFIHLLLLQCLQARRATLCWCVRVVKHVGRSIVCRIFRYSASMHWCCKSLLKAVTQDCVISGQ